MRIRFVKEVAGRTIGDTEDNPDVALCKRWRAAGVVELEEPPEPVTDRAIPSPAGRQPRGSGRGKG